jgi:hypothetical protein
MLRTSATFGVFVALVLGACNSDGTPTAGRVANPTERNVTCAGISQTGDDVSGPEACTVKYDDCTDGLTYEVICVDGECTCFVDGDDQGNYEGDAPIACGHDISVVKVLCGWVRGDAPAQTDDAARARD